MIPQHNTHHVILGAGLIGCYLGGAFTYTQQNVTLIAKAHFKNQLLTNYALSDYEGHHYSLDKCPTIISPDALDTLEQKADILWLTVKCLALESVIPNIVSCISANTIIICCQNGIANHLGIQKAFPDNTVIRAMVPFNVVNDEPGVFHRGSQGHMVLECADNIGDAIQWLSRQVNSDFLPTHTTYHMTELQWAKLQLNLGNAVNALANIPVKSMLENKHYRSLIAKLMLELLAVTNKKHIKLPKIANLPNKWIPRVLSLPDWMFSRVAQKMLAVDPNVRTSMWWDLQSKRLTEIDFLNAKVVEIGAQIGVKTPLNQKIVDLIKQAQEGNKITEEAFYIWVKSVK